MSNFKITNKTEFNERFNRVRSIALMMARTIDFMRQNGLCTVEDAKTLCLSDDTAAWVCGHSDTSTFVSFRIHIDSFKHPNAVLDYFKFKESKEQRERVANQYTYINFIFKNVVAIKLTVYTDKPKSRMYKFGLPFFISDFSDNNEHVRVNVRNTRIKSIYIPLFYEQFIEDVSNSSSNLSLVE